MRNSSLTTRVPPADNSPFSANPEKGFLIGHRFPRFRETGAMANEAPPLPDRRCGRVIQLITAAAQVATPLAIIVFGMVFAGRFSDIQQLLTALLLQNQTLVAQSTALWDDWDMERRRSALSLPSYVAPQKESNRHIVITDVGEEFLGEFRGEIDGIYEQLKLTKVSSAAIADSVVARIGKTDFAIEAANRNLSIQQLRGLVFAHLERKTLQELEKTPP